MGVCLACIAAETMCCVCGEAIKCCCCVIPCKTSVSSRSFYGIGFIFSTVLAWTLSRWGSDIPLVARTLTDSCGESCWNYFAVDRVSLAFVMYHGILLFLTLGIKNSRDPRAPLQNGFWPIKFLLWAGLIVATFFMPISAFSNYWIASFLFSAFFIILQAMLLVDFAWAWASGWVNNMETEENGVIYQVLLLGFTFLFYASVIAISALLYMYFASKPGCGLNTFFITFNLIFVVAMSIVSILPKVQEINPRSGIFQAAIISIYSTYLIGSAIGAQPNIDSSSCSVFPPGTYDDPWSRFITITGIAFTFIALGYSAVNLGSSDQFISVDGNKEDETESTVYNYSWFHFVLICAMMYVTAVLTQWTTVSTLDSSSYTFDNGLTAMWIKVVTSWISNILFIWTLIAPIIFPDRNFG